MSNESHPQRGDDDESEDNSDCDADLEHDPEQSIVSNAETTYLESNNSKKKLFLMCFGLTEDGGTPVLDLDTEPWKAIKKRDIKPSRMEYAEEIIRRSNLVSSTTAQDQAQQLKPANWNLAKCVQWLQVHPVVDQQDISFLKNEVHQLKGIILNAQQEQRDKEARQAGGQWRGRIPYMRLMLCLTEEDAIKAAVNDYRNRISQKENQETS
jgi:hypothetical protein